MLELADKPSGLGGEGHGIKSGLPNLTRKDEIGFLPRSNRLLEVRGLPLQQNPDDDRQGFFVSTALGEVDLVRESKFLALESISIF